METQQILEENIRLKKMIKKLEKNVQTDFLTKLLNKYGLDKSLPLVWSIAQRNKQQITMLMIDVDNFKGYNDTYGHCEGDIIPKNCMPSFSTITSNILRAWLRFSASCGKKNIPTP